MARIECECGAHFEISSTAMRVVCPECHQRFTVPQLDDSMQFHSQISSTMLRDLPVITNIEQHYAQSILAVGMSIPAEVMVAGAVAGVAGAAAVGHAGRLSQSAGSGPQAALASGCVSTGHSGFSSSDFGPGAGDGGSLTSGELLLGRYEVLRKIGQGGMSSVYEAHDQVRDEAVALKVLLPHLIRNPRTQERFLQEGRISSNFSHPNIARVYDLHQTESQMVLSMELLHGTTLRYDMHRRKQQGQRYRAVEVVNILRQICDALAIVHAADVVHRDLKPENLWLGLDGTVKVMDFGIARDATRAAHTTGPRGSGTPYYIAPEQMTASRTLDHRADQYSLAVIAYELLTGEIPQGAVVPPHCKHPQIPKRLSQAIFRGLDADPTRRFPTIGAFEAALHYEKRLPLVVRSALVALALAGLGSSGYAFARWGMPLLEPKVSPIWAELKPQVINERQALELPIKAPNATLSPAALEFQLLNDAPTGATIDPKGVLHWSPTEQQGPKQHSFKVVAFISENGLTRKEERSIQIDVREVYDPPIFETPAPVKVMEHKELLLDLVAKDPNEPQVGLRYELENPPAGMTIDARSGRLRWVPTEEMGGAHLEVPLRVSLARDDLHSLATVRKLSIDVEESIDFLTFTSSARWNVQVGQPARWRVLTHDPNTPALNSFYRLRGGERLGLTIDPKSGEMEWTPSEDLSGKSFEVTVEVCQGSGVKIQPVGEQTLKINVAEYRPQPIQEEAEAPSPSDVVAPLQPAPPLPAAVPDPVPANLPPSSGQTCPTPPRGAGGSANGQPGRPPQNQPSSGTCPQGNGQPTQNQSGSGQRGSVLLDVVETVIKVHKQKEQAAHAPLNPNPAPTISQTPLTAIPQTKLPLNKLPQNTLPQNNLPQNKLPQNKLPPPTPSSRGLPPVRLPQANVPSTGQPQPRLPQASSAAKRPAATNSAQSLESKIKQRVQQEVRSRLQR